MIELPLEFALPEPWKNKKFKTPVVGAINFLVGPNGSGKSRFAGVLKNHLPNARFLSTDRLNGMEGEGGGIRSMYGDHLAPGFAKSNFPNFKNLGTSIGSGLDTLIILEERLDLRIQIEATLSHLFNRKIRLEWDSGHLVAKATLGANGASYRLDREECHGIKELLVLLTHLYNDEHQSLIIDEPELNLHPQYQSFLMQEVRRLAGDPRQDSSKKIIFLITHSPFMLDFRSVEDVKAVISFDLKHAEPKHIFELDPADTTRLSAILPRLNVHHKQLFFSDNPIFVEGILDAQLLESIQESRGVSVSAAGSCIIDAGGCEEVNHYLTLCTAFAKQAYFLYDLDSLFSGNLRACVRGDSSVSSFLASIGVGGDFSKYCGELDKGLTTVIDDLLANTSVPAQLVRLKTFLEELGPRAEWKNSHYPRARVAVLSAISRERNAVIEATSASKVADLEGRLSQICSALKEKNVLLLPGGALERYLPSYAGDHYKMADEAKNAALADELSLLANGMTDEALASRYGELFALISELPSKRSVDADPVLRDYLSSYIHDLQGAVLTNPTWQLEEMQLYLLNRQAATKKIFSLSSFQRMSDGKFNAEVSVSPILGQKQRKTVVTQETNAGMRTFSIEPEYKSRVTATV